LVETIGKYEIHRVLGHGAMGTVYEALDPGIQRKVALKTMIPGLAETPDLRLRFLREAQAAGRLRHRNIVTVYDLGEDKGRPYIAMEYVEGTDLEKLIQNREPLSIEWKLDVIRQVCDGLCYAHKHGIVHRDIKPANIRVTPEGEVKIMDFGIAHLQSSNLTKSGIVMGTVHYMAPEQIEGHKVDHRADIFSVGTIAYELITYRKAFDGESITAVMYRIIHENPDPKELPRSEYSPALEALVMKALAKSAKERYQTLDELLLDLGSLLRDAAPRLAGRPSQSVDREADTQALVVDVDKEQQRRRALVETWIREAGLAMKHGETRKALELARQAQTFLPEDPAVKKLLIDVESEALRQRVEQEMAEMRVEVEEARAAGQLQRALSLCRRLLEINPEDVDVSQWAGEIEAEIREKEVEELCSQALAYATEGETDLALKIASRVEKFAPESARYLELKTYLGEEASRRNAGALTAAAQEHLAQGRLAEARDSAEQALAVLPSDAVAREIRDRVASVLAMRDKTQRAETAPAGKGVESPKAAAEQTPPVGLPAARVARPAPPAPEAVVSSSPAPRPAPPPPPAASPAPSASGAPPTSLPRAPERPPPPRPSPAPQAAAPAKPNPSPRAAPSAVVPATPVSRAASTTSAAPTPPALSASVAMPGRSPEPTALTPIPEGNPSNPEAAASLDAARRHLRERRPQEALPLLERAAELEPGHAGIQRILKLTRLEARKDEAEALTTSALEFFMKNKYAKARQAAEQALGLEPQNKKAKELMMLLAALG
jgi:tetratricopeptide (TPR) repeat protein/predicted Ser/Thr protein kinase